jgi:uncharacterized protein (TIGR03382 family)
VVHQRPPEGASASEVSTGCGSVGGAGLLTLFGLVGPAVFRRRRNK